MVQPPLLVVSEIGNRKLRSPLRTADHIQTGVGRDPCQPAFDGAAAFKAPELRKRFQKNFLRRFFNQTSLPEKPARHAEHTRTVTSHNLRKGRLVAILRLTRQVQVQGLFEPTRQLRSSWGLTDGGLMQKSNPPTPWGKRLLLVVIAHSAATCFELRFRLFQLGFLLRCQNGKHLLVLLELHAHQLRL